MITYSINKKIVFGCLVSITLSSLAMNNQNNNQLSNKFSRDLFELGTKCFVGGGLATLGVLLVTKFTIKPLLGSVVKRVVDETLADTVKKIIGKDVKNNNKLGEEIVDFMQKETEKRIDDICTNTLEPKIREIRKKLDDEIDLLVNNLKNNLTSLKQYVKKEIINSENINDDALLKSLIENLKLGLTDLKNHTKKVIIKSNKDENKDNSLLGESVETVDNHINKIIEDRLIVLLLGKNGDDNLHQSIKNNGLVEALAIKIQQEAKNTTKTVTKQIIDTAKKESRLANWLSSCTIL